MATLAELLRGRGEAGGGGGEGGCGGGGRGGAEADNSRGGDGAAQLYPPLMAPPLMAPPLTAPPSTLPPHQSSGSISTHLPYDSGIMGEVEEPWPLCLSLAEDFLRAPIDDHFPPPGLAPMATTMDLRFMALTPLPPPLPRCAQQEQKEGSGTAVFLKASPPPSPPSGGGRPSSASTRAAAPKAPRGAHGRRGGGGGVGGDGIGGVGAVDAPTQRRRAAGRSAPQELSPGVLFSRGSKNHCKGQCRPCRICHSETGCPNGAACNFCHHAHDDDRMLEIEVCRLRALRRRSEATMRPGSDEETTAGSEAARAEDPSSFSCPSEALP